MPFEIMNQRGISTSSHLYDDKTFLPEKNVGSPKPQSFHDHNLQGKTGASLLSISNPSSSLEMNANSGLPMSQTSLSGEVTEKLHVGGGGIVDALKFTRESMNHSPRSFSNVHIQPVLAPFFTGNKILSDTTSHESSLFSSSLSEMFSQKLRLTRNDLLSRQPVTIGSLPEEEPYKSLEEIEADTIGNLLPDEDDLFSSVANESGSTANARTTDDFEDFDMFSSGGGMELEGDNNLSLGKKIGSLDVDSGHFGGFKGNLPFSEQPFRTLFVRNINSNVEDSELKDLFEQYGDIRTIYTACKHRGFVMISYYDIRAAQKAMEALQNRSLRSRKLDIHYSLPKGNAPEKDISHGTLLLSGHDSSVSNDELQQIFGFYGEIKEIYESPEANYKKIIEFYDARAAEAALRALNRSDIAGRQIKLEPGHPRGMTCLKQESHNGLDDSDFGQSLRDNFSLRHKAMSSGVIASSCLENGPNAGFRSAIQQPMNALIDNAFSPVNSNILKSVRGPTSAKVPGVGEPSNFFDAMNFSSVPRFQPHSFPDYHDSFANSSPYNFSSVVGNVAGNMGTTVTDSSDNRHNQGIGSTGNPMEFTGAGSGNHQRHGLFHVWNNSNLHQEPSPNSNLLWQKTPSFVNGACAPGLSQIPGFPRTQPHMLRASHMEHHVGSAPVNASPWDRQLSYLGVSPDTSGLRMGSLGSAGLPGSWQMHPQDFSSRMFPHIGGNGAELTPTGGQNSPNQLSHVFPGRHPMTSMSKLDPNERMRNLYSLRKSETNINNADKKQYELDLGCIMRGEDSRTTLMIKNIPNKYTSKMLLAAIDEQCRGTYDFLYLPIDFKNKCNVGYAFINMIDPAQIIPFHQAFNGKKWEKFNSEKVASLAYARIQGKSALIAHFQNSSLMNEDKRCRPILFHSDGPNAGDPEPFPMGSNIRTRPGKSRISSNIEENRGQGSPSTLASGEGSTTNAIDSSSRNSD